VNEWRAESTAKAVLAEHDKLCQVCWNAVASNSAHINRCGRGVELAKCYGIGWQEIDGKNYTICLERRPYYCNRGNYIAKIIEVRGDFDLDGQSGWPRYYFDEDRAKLEIEAWLEKRGQRV
jgi:hypothetical protein